MSQKFNGLRRLRQMFFAFLLPSVVMVSATNVLAAERQEEEHPKDIPVTTGEAMVTTPNANQAEVKVEQESPRVIEVDMTEAQPEKSQAVKSLCSGIVPEIVVLKMKDAKVTVPIKEQVTEEMCYWKSSILYKWRVNQVFLLKGSLPEVFESIEVLKKNQEQMTPNETGIEVSFTNNEENEQTENDKTISDEQRAWEYENMKRGPAFAGFTWEDFQAQQNSRDSEQEDDLGGIKETPVTSPETGQGLFDQEEKQADEKTIPIGPGVDEFGNPIPRQEIVYKKPVEIGPGIVNKEQPEGDEQLVDGKEQPEGDEQLVDRKEQPEGDEQLVDRKEQPEGDEQLIDGKEQLGEDEQLVDKVKQRMEEEKPPVDDDGGQLVEDKILVEDKKKVAEEITPQNSVKIGSAEVVYREPVTVPDSAEVYMMAQGITAEAGGCGTEEMIYVGVVMKNRRDSNYRSFGRANTIQQVLSQSGQYPTTWRKIQRGLKPTAESLTIAEQLLNGSIAEVYRDGRNLLNGTMLWQTNSRATWATQIFRTPHHYYSISE